MISSIAARPSCAILAVLVAALSGCAYKGAIYSSYQEFGLGIRTTAESDAPVKVHVGYDHSVAAFVPRRGGDARSEEATSLISKEAVGSQINPTKSGTGDLLTVDSAFISGTAAIVASAPSNAIVRVLDGGAACPTDARSASGIKEFKTQGSPGDRVGVALTQDGTLSIPQVRLSELMDVLRSKPIAEQATICGTAITGLPPATQAAYAGHPAHQSHPADVFASVTIDYINAAVNRAVAEQQVLDALRRALQGG